MLRGCLQHGQGEEIPIAPTQHDPDKIIDRISETLGVMLDVEFVCTVQMGNGKEVRLPFTRSDTWVRGDMADRIAPH